MTAFNDIARIILGLTGIGEQLGEDRALAQAVRDRAPGDEPPEDGQGVPQVGEEYLGANTPGEVFDFTQFIMQTAFGGIFEGAEDFVAGPIRETGSLTPDNIDDPLARSEGGSIALTAGVIAGNLLTELLGGTQLESHQMVSNELIAALVLDEAVGRELGMLMSKGVDPALEAKIAKETRSEFVDLQDAVEFALRNKTQDEGYLQAEGATDKVIDRIGSNEPINTNNLLEEWGIRDDNIEILEEVALSSMEFEELIETPAELGLIVDDETLDLILDLEGYPESLKDFLRQVNDAIPRSNRVWEEKTAVEPLVDELETLVRNGEISPEEAVDQIPDEIADAREALRDRFTNIDPLPPGRPSQSEFTDAFAFGYTDRETWEERLSQSEYETETYPGVTNAIILEELDGSLRTAVGLGLIDEATYTDLATDVGLGEDDIDSLLRGRDLDEVAQARLQDTEDPRGAGLTSIPQIGSQRANSLRQAGIETVQDLAQADPETVAEAIVVNVDFAQRLIQAANIRSQAG